MEKDLLGLFTHKLPLNTVSLTAYCLPRQDKLVMNPLPKNHSIRESTSTDILTVHLIYLYLLIHTSGYHIILHARSLVPTSHMRLKLKTYGRAVKSLH